MRAISTSQIVFRLHLNHKYKFIIILQSSRKANFNENMLFFSNVVGFALQIQLNRTLPRVVYRDFMTFFRPSCFIYHNCYYFYLKLTITTTF